MAAETLIESTTPAPAVEVAVAETEKSVVKDPPPAPEEHDAKKPTAPTADEKKPTILPAASFKEESNLASDLTDLEKKALDELKQLVQAALAAHELSPPTAEPPTAVEEKATAAAADDDEEKAEPPAAEEKPADDDGAKTVEAIEETVVSVVSAVDAAAPAAPPEEVSIWGVNLFADDRTDTVLLKFLRARDLKLKDALAMLKNAVAWRREFGIDALVDSDLSAPEFNKAVFMHGVDRDGHPVCYNVYGEFQDPGLYALAFSDEEKRNRFLRWRIQFLERGIRRHLDFAPGGVSTMVQITDLRNSPGPLKRELRLALALLQDNYPEFAAKQVFINVPWWYLAFNSMISRFFTQRMKNKFVFAGPSKSAETLLKYIAAEQVPVQFGGLGKENDPDFSAADPAIDTTLKPSTKQIIEIPVTEACVLVWEVRVLGWEVSYGAEFVPSSEDGYTVIIQKSRKMVVGGEAVVRNGFKISEAGKVVLMVDNPTSKKKKLLYRYKAKKSIESMFDAAERKESKC